MTSRTFPVVEIFGPTIQGEGPHQGQSAVFVRFGGCDYRCSWCDTPHAVLPRYVRTAERLDVDRIIERVNERGPARWLVLTGGNPALHDLGDLVTRAQGGGFRVAVETQGSRMRPWLGAVDSLCISPKPPSSGMNPTLDELPALSVAYDHYLGRLMTPEERDTYIKIPIFTNGDLLWADWIARHHRGMPLYLTAGNDAGRTVARPDRIDQRSLEQVRNELCGHFRWLVHQVQSYPYLRQHATVQLQTHVLAWGNELGH